MSPGKRSTPCVGMISWHAFIRCMGRLPSAQHTILGRGGIGIIVAVHIWSNMLLNIRCQSARTVKSDPLCGL